MRGLPGALFLSLIILSPADADELVPIVGDSAYPPYAWQDGDTARGIYVDMLREVSKRMLDFDLAIDLMPWKRALNEMETGAAVAVFPPYHHPGQRPYIEPYSVPLSIETVVTVCTPAIARQLGKGAYPDNLIGFTVGNNAGYMTPGEAFFALAKSGKIDLAEMRSTELNLINLALGRIDCYVNDRLAIFSELARMTKTGDWPTKAKPPVEVAIVQEEKAYLGYSKPSPYARKEELRAAIDATLAEMEKDGTTARIVASYLGTPTIQ